MANGDTNGNFASNIPVWAKAVTVVGIPGVIALFLVWTGAQTLPAIQSEVRRGQAISETNRELIVELVRQQRETYRLMQRICANTATTAADRADCFRVN